MRARAVVLASAIVLAPPGARTADLMVWWQKGFYVRRPSCRTRSRRRSRPTSHPTSPSAYGSSSGRTC